MFRPAPSRLLCVALAMAGVQVASAEATSLDEARQLHREGRLEGAAAAYRAVLAEPGLEASDLAAAQNNLCVVLDGLGELRAAETECRGALERRRDLGDRLRLARTQNNLGLVLQHLGEYSEAEESFETALGINRDLGEARSQAINLANLGVVATASGRFQQALGFHRAVSELGAAHADEAWAVEQLLIAELNRGVVLERLGAFKEAIDVYKRLLARSAEIDPVQRASILVNSGVVYRNLGDPVRAIEHFEEAAALYGELGDPLGLANAELNIGVARHLNLEDYDAAEASYRKVLALVEQSGEREIEIETLVFLGRLLLGQNRLAEARTVFGACLDRALETGSAEGIWAARGGLGETERAGGDLESAVDYFQQAIEAIEESRATVIDQSYRNSFFATKRDVYAGAAVTLAELDRRWPGQGYAGRALEVAQRAKARDLLDALGSQRNGLARTAALESAELSRRLGPDVLVEFLVTATDLLVWRVTSDAITLSTLGDPEPILVGVKAVHEALSNGSSPPEVRIAALSLVIGGSLMPLPAEGANLFIAPDRRLHYLPFELLSVAGTTPSKLVERAAVSYLPSAWALAEPVPEGGDRRREPSLGFVGFGDIEYSVQGLTPVARDVPRSLPAAGRELFRAAECVSGESRIFSGAAATESAFRQTGSVAQVLHFATHTMIGEGSEGGTAILLSAEGRDDGLLSPGEIANQTIDADLVVLAACSTALGAEDDGSALTTLTGSFLAAGSRAVLATLWDVGDQPTAVFMDQFYYRLSKGLSPAQALRRAKLEFMADQRWQSPDLWSGYVLVGSAPPFETRESLWMWVGVLAVAVVVGFTIRRARTPKD